MEKKTTRPDGANTPALPSRRAFFGTAAAVASVAAVPALASVSPTSAPSTAEPSDFARALSMLQPAWAEYDRTSEVLDDANEARRPLQLRIMEAESAVKTARKTAYDEIERASFEKEEMRKRMLAVKESMEAGSFTPEEVETAVGRAGFDLFDELRAEAEQAPLVIAAKKAWEAAKGALQAHDKAIGLDAISTAAADASDRYYQVTNEVMCARPADLAELLHKSEVLAIHRWGTDLDFSDVLDWLARDLWHLGARHKLSDESARLDRNFRQFDDSPEFDADRSKATWRYIEGRGMVAVVTP